MKQLACKLIMLLLVVGFSSNILTAKEFKKNIKKEFSITSNGTVGLSNKYGKIDVKTWAGNQVKIDVTITVKARNQADANDVFDRITIDFTNTGKYVKAVTEIESVKSSWGWHSKNNDYDIDYEVFMPKTCNLELANRYGDAFISELGGRATLSVKYGNMRLATVKDHLNITLKYGNCTVVKANNSEVTLQYGNIHLKEVENVEFSTCFSKIKVDQAVFIKSESKNDIYTLGSVKEFRNHGRYDHIDIREVENIVAASQYSDFTIGVVQKSGDFDMVYGGVVINEISKAFSEILMVGKYTDFKLKVEEGAPYKLDATCKYAGFLYPQMLNVIFEQKDGMEKHLEAYAGANRNPNSYIKARVNHGGLEVD